MIRPFLFIALIVFSQYLQADIEKLERAKTKFLLGDYSCIESLKKLASTGDPEAEYLLGQAYFLGKGTIIDLKVSKEWYLKSANNGWSQAQNLVANYYIADVFGYEKSFNKAVNYLEKAAENGYFKAICNLVYLERSRPDIFNSTKWTDHVDFNRLNCRN